MSITTFPEYATLLLQGHDYVPQVELQRVLYDDGAVRQARLTSRVHVHRNVEYTLCGANQLKSFKQWWLNDLRKGSRYFLWKDPISERVGDDQYSYGRFFEGKVEYTALDPTFDVWSARFVLELWDTGSGAGAYVWIDPLSTRPVGSITITGTSSFSSINLNIPGLVNVTVPVNFGTWSHTFTATTPGAYTATATAGGLSATSSFTLTPAVASAVTIDPLPDLTSGSAGTVTISGTSTASAVQLNITGPGGLNTSPFISVSGGVWSYNISAGTPGTYNVTASIPGASASDSFNVTTTTFSVTIDPVPDMTTGVSSAGFSITGTSSSSPIDFTISGPGGLNVISGVAAPGGVWSVPVNLPAPGSYTVSAAIPGASATDTFLITAVAPSFVLTLNTTSVDEGSSVSLTITASNIESGSPFFWKVIPVSGSITADDFTDGLLSGPITLNNGVPATITRTVIADSLLEGPESFKLELRANSILGAVVGTSSTITINDTSVPPAGTITVNSYTIFDGATPPPSGHTPTNSITVAVANGSSTLAVWLNVTVTGLTLSSTEQMVLSGLAAPGVTPFNQDLIFDQGPPPAYPTSPGTYWVRTQNFLTLVAGTGPAVPGSYTWFVNHEGTTYDSFSATITS